jgi:hypothetical protein
MKGEEVWQREKVVRNERKKREKWEKRCVCVRLRVIKRNKATA